MGVTSSSHGVSVTVLIIVACSCGISPLGTDMYLPAIPEITSDLQTTTALVQLTLTLFMLGFGVGQYLIGALSDLWGRRRLLVIGTGLAAVGSAVAALAPTIGLLLTARLLQGIGAAAGAVLSRAVIADTAHGVLLAKQLSLMMMIQGVLPVAAPLLGSVLAGPIGWRGIMWVIAAYAAILFVCTIAGVPETLPRSRRSGSPISRALLDPLRTLRSPRFASLALGFMMAFGVLFAYISGSSTVLQEVFGLSQLHYGLAFSINAVVMIVGSALNARLLQSFSQRKLAHAGTALMLVGCAGVVVSAATAPMIVFFVGFVTVATLGISFVLPNLTSLALSSLSGDQRGSGSAVLGTGQALMGALVSPAVGLGGAITPLSVGIVMLVCSVVVVSAVLYGRRSA